MVLWEITVVNALGSCCPARDDSVGTGACGEDQRPAHKIDLDSSLEHDEHQETGDERGQDAFCPPSHGYRDATSQQTIVAQANIDLTGTEHEVGQHDGREHGRGHKSKRSSRASAEFHMTQNVDE